MAEPPDQTFITEPPQPEIAPQQRLLLREAFLLEAYIEGGVERVHVSGLPVALSSLGYTPDETAALVSKGNQLHGGDDWVLDLEAFISLVEGKVSASVSASEAEILQAFGLFSSHNMPAGKIPKRELKKQVVHKLMTVFSHQEIDDMLSEFCDDGDFFDCAAFARALLADTPPEMRQSRPEPPGAKQSALRRMDSYA